MNRTTLLHMGVGFILALAGAAMLYVSKGDVKTSAQGTTPYTSTWTANNVLTADVRVGSSQVGQAGIGVWGWSVTGTVGSKTFSETWAGPSITNIQMLAHTDEKGCDINGVNTAEIMSGCFTQQNALGGTNSMLYTFAVRAPNDFTSTKNRLNGGTGTQKTVSCISSPRNGDEDECIMQSGAYTFQHWYEPGFDSRARFLGSGTLMPLKWTVTGTVTN